VQASSPAESSFARVTFGGRASCCLIHYGSHAFTANSEALYASFGRRNNSCIGTLNVAHHSPRPSVKKSERPAIRVVCTERCKRAGYNNLFPKILLCLSPGSQPLKYYPRCAVARGSQWPGKRKIRNESSLIQSCRCSSS
jgi:hypothetical protein